MTINRMINGASGLLGLLLLVVGLSAATPLQAQSKGQMAPLVFQPPAGATINAPTATTQYVNVPISFIGSSDSGVSFNWTFGDGATSTLQNPTHTYTSTGSYTVRLACGATGYAVSYAYLTLNLVVAPPPAITSFTALANPVPYGSLTYLNPVFSGGTGAIDQGIGAVTSGTNYPTGILHGSKTFTLTVTNPVGVKVTSPITINTQTVIVAPISPANPTVTVSTTRVFSTYVTGGAQNTYIWSSTAGSWVGGNWTAPATPQAVTITATSVDDPTKVATTTVTVVAAPVITGFSAATNPVPDGGSTTITPTFSGGTGVVDQGVGSVTSGAGFSTGALFTPKTYTLTVTNAANATTTASVSVGTQTVNVGPISPANPTVTVSTITTFTASVTGGAQDTVSWSSTGGSWSGNAWTAPATPGNVTITATSTDDSHQISTTNVTVVAAPAITGFSAATNPVPDGGSTIITPTFSGGTGSVDQGVGTVTSGAGFSTGALFAPRTYTLTVKNAANTTITINLTVGTQTVSVGPISPANPTVTVSTITTFTASVTGGAQDTVSWSSTGGSWSGNAWTAPATPGNVTITATSTDDSHQISTTNVTVVAAPVITGFSAATNPVPDGGSTIITPTFSGGTGSVDQGVGTVTSGAGFSTGALFAPKPYILTVTNAAKTTATANVTVNTQTVSVGPINPANPTVTASTITYFTSSVSGGTQDTVTWSSTAGSWFGNAWTAPATPGNVTITATSTDDPTRTASATVTVVALPSDNIVASTTFPLYGATITVTPTFTGGTAVVGTSAGASDISANAVSGTPYVTPPVVVPMTYYVRVTNAGGTHVDAGTSIVTPQTVSVGAISPANPTRTVSTNMAFSTTVTGGVQGTVSWSSTAGSWSGNVWTAPASAQSVTITATSVDNPTKTASTTVAVVAAPSVAAFSAVTNPVPDGGSTIVTPVFSGGTGSVDQGIGSVTSGAGFSTGALFAPKTYTITVTNAAGTTSSAICTVGTQPVSVGAITPANVTRTVSTITTFSSSVSGGAQDTVAWSSTSGTWSGNVWTAPSVVVPPVTITATSTDDSTKTATTTVTVVAAPTASIAPSTTTPNYGSTITVTPTFTGGTAIVGTSQGASDISVGATSGTPYGTSPITAPIGFWVRVTNAAGTFVDAYSGTVTPQVTVAVPTSNLVNGQTYIGNSTTFNTQVTGTSNTAVNWSVSGGGSIGLTTGVFTATTNGDYIVTATSQADGTKSASTTVHVVAITITVVPSLSPAPVVVKAGATQMFSASVTGPGTPSQAVTWSVVETDGGTIGANGLYTAPSTQGNYTVQATSVQFPGFSQNVTVRVPGWALVWKRDIIYMGTKEVVEIDVDGVHVTQVDHLGSPRFVTNSVGAVETTQKYLPFGETLDVINLIKTRTTGKGYTNHEQTDPSGLIYMQARFYAPQYHRFTSTDPGKDQHFEDTQSWNIYSYVRNNPTMAIDPTGMDMAFKMPSEGDASDDAAIGFHDPGGNLGDAANLYNQKFAQSEFLAKATLLKIGFTDSQATEMVAAHVTAQQLGAAVITHEHRGETERADGDASGVQAGIIALMNRTTSSGWNNFNALKGGITQEGLSESSNNILQALTAKRQFLSLTGNSEESNRGFISNLILGRDHDSGYSYATNKMNSFYTSDIKSFRQIWSSPTTMEYDIRNRTRFHGAGKSEPGGIVIGGHVYFQEGYQ